MLRRIAVVLALLALTGCTRDAAPSAEASTPPASLEPIPGSALHKVHLSDAGAASLQVRTVPVRLVAGQLVIPTTAVIHDPKGVSWTYRATGPQTYQRQSIGIDHITGTDAVLRSGPPAGTPVVTVGAPELLGAEYGVGEE